MAAKRILIRLGFASIPEPNALASGEQEIVAESTSPEASAYGRLLGSYSGGVSAISRW